MSNITVSRRGFLKAGSILGAASAVPLSFAADHARVGVQLYTARHVAEKDLFGVLENLANIGYTDIEFAGLYGHKPEDVRKKLDGLGLKAPSAHVPLTSFQNDLESVIETAKIMGHHYLVMPWLSIEQRSGGIKTYYKLADDLNRYGEACRKHGLLLAYHNHDFEFEQQDGELPYDVLLKQVPAEHMLMELDLFWITKAGYSPQDYFAKHPGRFPLWHVKDMGADGNFADVGTGTIDFSAIFAQRKLAGFQHGFVEHDRTQALQTTLETSYANTKKLMHG